MIIDAVTVKPLYQPEQIIEHGDFGFGKIIAISARIFWNNEGERTVSVVYSMKNGGSTYSVEEKDVKRVLE